MFHAAAAPRTRAGLRNATNLEANVEPMVEPVGSGKRGKPRWLMQGAQPATVAWGGKHASIIDTCGVVR